MQRFAHNTLFLACFISLGLVSCGGGNINQVTSNSVTNSTFALDESNNLYISTDGTNYSKVETTGFPGGNKGDTNFTTQAGSNIGATVGSEGYISVSSNLQSWQAATAPATLKINGLTLSLALYNVIMGVENNSQSSSLGSSTNNIRPTIILAVGQGGNIQEVSSASSNLSLTQAVKQHKLKYRQVAAITNNDLYGVAQSGNGNFIVVGTNNTVLLSQDMGGTFKSINLPISSSASNANSLQNFYDVEAVNMDNMLVAVGDNASIITSTDNGITWKSQTEAIQKDTGYNNAFLTVKGVVDQNTGKLVLIAGGLGQNQDKTVHSPIVYNKNGLWHSAQMPSELQNQVINVRDIAKSGVNGDQLTAYAVAGTTSSTLSARDIFLRKRNLTDANQVQIVLTSNDYGATWVEQSVTSNNSASSSSVGSSSPVLSTIQNMFNNPQTTPTSDFADTITNLSLSPLGFLVGGS